MLIRLSTCLNRLTQGASQAFLIPHPSQQISTQGSLSHTQYFPLSTLKLSILSLSWVTVFILSCISSQISSIHCQHHVEYIQSPNGRFCFDHSGLSTLLHVFEPSSVASVVLWRPYDFQAYKGFCGHVESLCFPQRQQLQQNANMSPIQLPWLLHSTVYSNKPAPAADGRLFWAVWENHYHYCSLDSVYRKSVEECHLQTIQTFRNSEDHC